MKDAYAVLGVARSASRLAIHRRYRQLAKRLHPDRNPAPDAAERFRDLHSAYQTLIDADARRALDAWLAVHPSPPRPAPPPVRRPPKPPAKDPIEQWRDDNRSLQRTVNTLVGGVAGGMLGLRFALLAETPQRALVILVGGGLLGLIAGYLLRRFDVFGLW